MLPQPLRRKIRRETVFRTLIPAIALIAALSCSSNSGEDDSASAAIARRFRSMFYDNGHPFGENRGNAEYVYGVMNNEVPCGVFRELTGMDAVATRRYEYHFISDDGKCAISLSGMLDPPDLVYAEFTVRIPGCPEISTLKMVHYMRANYGR